MAYKYESLINFLFDRGYHLQRPFSESAPIKLIPPILLNEWALYVCGRKRMEVNATLNSPDGIYRHENAFIYKGGAVYPRSRQNRNVTKTSESLGTHKW